MQKKEFGMKRRRIQSDSKLKLNAIPGIELFEVICPKDHRKLGISHKGGPSSSNSVHVVLKE